MGVWFAILNERTITEPAFGAALNLAMRAGRLGYARINVPYTRVDVARNHIAREFCAQTGDPDDVLIMLDCDHDHPYDVLERLVADNLDVVGALAFRRCEPFDPQMYRRSADGEMLNPTQWEQGLIDCDALGMAAIAIRRRVFDRLEAGGLHYPWFRFGYKNGEDSFPSEDVYFCLLCKGAGISICCDTRIISPHLTAASIGPDDWQRYLEDHPDEYVNQLPS